MSLFVSYYLGGLTLIRRYLVNIIPLPYRVGRYKSVAVGEWCEHFLRLIMTKHLRRIISVTVYYGTSLQNRFMVHVDNDDIILVVQSKIMYCEIWTEYPWKYFRNILLTLQSCIRLRICLIWTHWIIYWWIYLE